MQVTRRSPPSCTTLDGNTPQRVTTPRARRPPLPCWFALPLRGAASRGRGAGAHLSHCLQKLRVSCLGMPSVMSTRARRQPTHMLAGLGGMGTPQWQHRLRHEEEISQSHTEPQRKHKVHAGICFVYPSNIKRWPRSPPMPPPLTCCPGCGPPAPPCTPWRRLSAQHTRPGAGSERRRRGRLPGDGGRGGEPREGGRRGRHHEMAAASSCPSWSPHHKMAAALPCPAAPGAPATRWRQRPPAPGCSPHRSRGTGPGPLTRCAL